MYTQNLVVCYLKDLDVIYHTVYFTLSLVSVFRIPFSCVLVYNTIKRNKVPLH
jgi:hypothetical protein